MIQNSKNNLPLLQFPSLIGFKNLNHGVFTRQNEDRAESGGWLNVSFGVGDDPGVVVSNREKISRCLETELVFSQQIHGTGVRVFARSDTQALKALSKVRPGDAMVTDRSGIALVIQVADCQPVFLYDPVRQAVGNIHAGWRGSISNILARTVEVMDAEFGCKPRNLMAAIGPSLGPCCAEFIHFRSEIPEHFWQYRQHENRFDFWQISRDQLVDAGVNIKNISVANLCTSCRTDLFFSYRKERKTGRFAAVIGLKNREGDGNGQ